MFLNGIRKVFSWNCEKYFSAVSDGIISASDYGDQFCDLDTWKSRFRDLDTLKRDFLSILQTRLFIKMHYFDFSVSKRLDCVTILRFNDWHYIAMLKHTWKWILEPFFHKEGIIRLLLEHFRMLLFKNVETQNWEMKFIFDAFENQV